MIESSCIQQSATTLRTLTCEGNNTDYLITMVPVKRLDIRILDNKKAVGKKMDRRKDLRNFDSGQFVISRTTGLVGCSQNAGVHTYPQVVQRMATCKQSRIIDVNMEQKLAHLVQPHRRAIVAQIAEKCNAGIDWQLSEHSALQLATYGCWPLSTPEGSSIRIAPGSNGRSWIDRMNHVNDYEGGEMRVWSRVGHTW